MKKLFIALLVCSPLIAGTPRGYTPPAFGDGDSSGEYTQPRPDFPPGGPYISSYSTLGHLYNNGGQLNEVWGCTVRIHGDANTTYTLDTNIASENGTPFRLYSVYMTTDASGNATWSEAWSTNDTWLPVVTTDWRFEFVLLNAAGGFTYDRRTGSTPLTPG
jgi:hypothetical protein